MAYFNIRNQNLLFVIPNPCDPNKKYEIEYKDEKSIWISDGTGEGGEFSNEKFFEMIDKFYKENF